MFESASGRALVEHMPRNKVVPESDGPFAQIAGKPVMPWCADLTAMGLSSQWKVSVEDAVSIIQQNGEQLLKLVRGFNGPT